MSTTTATYKQYLRAKSEVESSMTNARSLRDQWLAAVKENPTNLTKKEVERIGKAFKNRLLTVKWDCEDLEELVNVCENSKLFKYDVNESIIAKCFTTDCRNEISKMMAQMEQIELDDKVYQKHGITMPTTSAPATTLTSSLKQSIVTTPTTGLENTKYQRLLDNNNVVDSEEIQFDKTQLEHATSQTSPTFNSASIFNNALYDHVEQFEDRQFKTDLGSFNNRPQVFNNLSRPVTNVYMNPNDNEVILDMLETEYYNPPSLQSETRVNYAIRKLLDISRNRIVGTIAFIFSFPILIIIFLAL